MRVHNYDEFGGNFYEAIQYNVRQMLKSRKTCKTCFNMPKGILKFTLT